MQFADRSDAGRQLADVLRARDWNDPVVLALPRGGVPVAYEIATALCAPLDVFIVRKVGAPDHAEYGIGAIAEGGTTVMNERVDQLSISEEQFEQLAAEEATELERRTEEYRGDRELPPLAKRDVLVVDDGLATGVTAEAAVRALRAYDPARIVLAAPVVSADGRALLERCADDVIFVLAPDDFHAVGQWYEQFDATSDDEVEELLRQAGATS